MSIRAQSTAKSLLTRAPTGTWTGWPLAVVLFVVVAGVIGMENGPPSTLALVLVAAIAAPLGLRRRWPLAAFGCCLAALLAYLAHGYPHAPVLPALMVALYAVVAAGSRGRGAALGLLTAVLLSLVALFADTPGPVEIFGMIGWIALSLAAAEIARARQRAAAFASERARRIEESRAEETRRRVTEERLHIARELHDVLAHSISIITVQASVARHLGDAAGLERAVVVIDDAAQSAMSSLRATLGVLRADDDEEPPPTPGLADIDDLVTRGRDAGLAIRWSTTGEPPAAPPATVQLSAYRIVQECLTNAAKHAPGATIDVELAYPPGAVRLRVSDDGRSRPADGGNGYGIVGMRERARAVGGGLTAERGPNGGFTVTASLPYGAA